jgi:hypothetical protein
VGNLSVAILPALIAGVFSLAAVLYMNWENKRIRARDKAAQEEADDEARERANDPEVRRLESEAYERARASYEAALRTARAEAKRLEARMTNVEARASAAEDSARRANDRATACEREAANLTMTVDALRRILREQHIPIPAHLNGDDTRGNQQ